MCCIFLELLPLVCQSVPLDYVAIRHLAVAATTFYTRMILGLELVSPHHATHTHVRAYGTIDPRRKGPGTAQGCTLYVGLYEERGKSAA